MTGLQTADHPAFIFLPIELIIEVLKLLSWKDILRLRATCRILAEATRTRTIWAHLIEEHIASAPQPPLLERPLSMHTPSELEHLLLLWKSAEIGWKTDDGHPARTRLLHNDVLPFAHIHLVNGGRWLLLVTETGATTYCDLDAETITRTPLIPDQIKRRVSHTRFLMSVDYDLDAPLLSLRLAFAYTELDRTNVDTPFRSTIQIWGIDVVLDTISHRAVGLRAARLSSIPMRSTVHAFMQISLCGPTVAFVAYCKLGWGHMHIITVEWAQADGNSTDYLWRFLRPTSNQTKIRLLRGQKVVTIARGVLSLYEYSTIKETTIDYPYNGQPKMPLVWSIVDEDLSYTTETSSYLTTATFSRILVCFACSIRAVDIEHTPSLVARPPPLIKLTERLPLSFARSYTAGYAKAVATNLREGQLRLIYYPDAATNGTQLSTSPRIYKNIVDNGNLFGQPIMDENTGRVLLFRNGTAERFCITVVDFALVRKASALE